MIIKNMPKSCKVHKNAGSIDSITNNVWLFLYPPYEQPFLAAPYIIKLFVFAGIPKGSVVGPYLCLEAHPMLKHLVVVHGDPQIVRVIY